MSIKAPLRNPAFALAFTLVVAVATGCMAAGLMPIQKSNPVVIVGYGDMASSHIGEARALVLEPQTVMIRRGLPATQQRRVVTHEMFHAAGFLIHNMDPECYSYRSQGDDGPIRPPCRAEVVQIRRVQRTFTVVVRDAALLEDVQFAVGLWNRAAGRVVFVLSR